LAIIIGATGGVGIYATQINPCTGAKEVIGIARNPAKLEKAKNYGATYTISTMGKDAKAIKEEFKAYCKTKGIPSNYGWKVFEWTGTGEARRLPWSSCRCRYAGNCRLRHAKE